MEGRFINFYRSSDETGFVQLCEVKVYGGRNPVHHYTIMKVGDGCTSTTVGKTFLANVQMLIVLIAQMVVHGHNNARVRGFPPTTYYIKGCTDSIVRRFG